MNAFEEAGEGPESAKWKNGPVKETVYAVSEAQQILYDALTEYTGWTFLKGQRCLKRKVGNIVFEIDFYSSRENASHKNVDIYCEFLFWNRSFDKLCNVNSKIGFLNFRPENGCWYDISTKRALDMALEDIKRKTDRYVTPVVEEFQRGCAQGILFLSDGGRRELYSLNQFGAFRKMLKDGME